jgi:hypothetical protein
LMNVSALFASVRFTPPKCGDSLLFRSKTIAAGNVPAPAYVPVPPRSGYCLAL